MRRALVTDGAFLLPDRRCRRCVDETPHPDCGACTDDVAGTVDVGRLHGAGVGDTELVDPTYVVHRLEPGEGADQRSMVEQIAVDRHRSGRLDGFGRAGRPNQSADSPSGFHKEPQDRRSNHAGGAGHHYGSCDRHVRVSTARTTDQKLATYCHPDAMVTIAASHMTHSSR